MSDLIWAAIIAAIPPTVAAFYMGRKNARKIDSVHSLANDRLTQALQKVEDLQRLIEGYRNQPGKQGRVRRPRGG